MPYFFDDCESIYFIAKKVKQFPLLNKGKVDNKIEAQSLFLSQC